MLRHYIQIMWLCVGAYLLLKPFEPWARYVIGAFIVVLSIIAIFGA